MPRCRIPAPECNPRSGSFPTRPPPTRPANRGPVEIDLFEGGFTQGSVNPNDVLAMHYAGATADVAGTSYLPDRF
jgi:hypothetical protein